ncbi:hypothetical protein AB1Y20_003739 [Prymnesium parvum]|uniref:HAT C-terminal dimerisation domain-containing protein n=1 Tax=Prymnesium parvum TaxID=97485 RepID=A0AB34J5N0_PRYPA
MVGTNRSGKRKATAKPPAVLPDMIVEFKEREKIRLEMLEKAAEEKRLEKQAAKDAHEKALADEAAARRQTAKETQTGASGNPMGRAAATAATVVVDVDAGTRGPSKGSRRSSPWWKFFTEKGSEDGHANCILHKAGALCDESIKCTTGLRNHIMYVHPEEFVRVQSELKMKEESENKLKTDAGQQKVVQAQVQSVPAKIRDKLHLAHSRWLVKNKRPLSLPEDKEYRDIWELAMHGAYVPPDATTVRSGVLKLSAEGLQKLRQVNTELRDQGLKATIAGDIWSDRGVSLFGIVQYHIDYEWNIVELLTAATPFSDERHTGDAIDKKTAEACSLAGLSYDVFSSVFFAVSDNGANMVKGWDGFGRAPCCVHTVQLSVKLFLSHTAIAPLRVKQKGIVTHFSQSTGVDGLQALKATQKKCLLPVHHPVRDNDTRWSGSYDQMEFFRIQQRAIQLYDVEHARKAGDVYRLHQLDLEDWLINVQAVAVLQPVADWTQHMQGTKSYATLPLILPTIYNLMESMTADANLVLAFQGERPYELQPDEMHAGVLAARTLMFQDFKCRWIDNLKDDAKRVYAISTLLHPCFKSYSFIEDLSFIPAADKRWALKELRTEWQFSWNIDSDKQVEDEPNKEVVELDGEEASPTAGTAAQATPGEDMAPATSSPQLIKKKGKVTLGGLLVKKKRAELLPDEPTRPQRDELEEYLNEEEEVDVDMDVLKWWRGQESRWPKLSKMVKQYFASPASSAGVERVFSAAGKMHDDLKKAAKDSTLQHSLFAATNAD